jgi:hypothetical protein
MLKMRCKTFKSNLSVHNMSPKNRRFEDWENAGGITRNARKRNTHNGVTAVTVPIFYLGETSIVNIGSEGEYESSLRAGCHEAAVERGSRG